ncbi:MAG: hypothetical protein M0Z65_07040 [Firmicutes bacterium]|uniref:Uncharacterized protein n=1 Tax=Melghirimyces thermohalophilus TaxID=1236220 RepID=A0A1G6K8V0_9BACL|nr:hypothetical protein [Melghirimyces thermohalophilus]MDA8352934.1 hypothetical protein [Bacillota bacterium]SDC26736.1 hypothetical protein SAMN04488112_105100 [Melghirimyces thermohalophilus]
MFGLPMETFYWFAPWPVFWMGLALVMYVKLKREDEQEERSLPREGED